jgi:hypothetical protein
LFSRSAPVFFLNLSNHVGKRRSLTDWNPKQELPHGQNFYWDLNRSWRIPTFQPGQQKMRCFREIQTKWILFCCLWGTKEPTWSDRIVRRRTKKMEKEWTLGRGGWKMTINKMECGGRWRNTAEFGRVHAMCRELETLKSRH